MKTKTTWTLYECDHGARWSATTDGPFTEEDGASCEFSGCAPGHAVHRVGRTEDLHEAHTWFREPGHTHTQSCPSCGGRERGREQA